MHIKEAFLSDKKQIGRENMSNWRYGGDVKHRVLHQLIIVAGGHHKLAVLSFVISIWIDNGQISF